MVDPNKIPGDIAPLNQVDSAAGLHEPRQASNLSIESIAQVQITPKITSPPSWVTV